MLNKRVTNSPIAIQLHLTRKCNLNCYYCSADEFIKKEKEKELDTKEWVNLLKRLKEIQVFDVSFSGGEIFLRKDIFKILETAVKCNFPKMRLTTNGTLISDAVAKRLKSLNFKNIEISLDGNKEMNDQIRGEGSFNKTIEGINNLVNNGIIPSIRFTPLKNNYKKLNEMADLLYSFNIKKFALNSLKPTGKCSKIYKDIMLDFFIETEELHKIIDNIREKYSDFKIGKPDKFYKNVPIQYYENRLSLNSKNKQKLKPCSAAHSSCNITSSGWIIPCSELFDFKGGNIREKDILDIWRNSENFKRIRSLSSVSIDQIPYCRNCKYNVFCNAGCRANAYAVYGDLLAPDPFCPYWKEK